MQESCVFVNLQAATAEEALRGLAKALEAHGAVRSTYADAAWEREQRFPTGLPTRPFPIAFPHAGAEHCLATGLAVALLGKPLSFGNMGNPAETLAVEALFMLASPDAKEHLTMLQMLADLFGDPAALSDLRACRTAGEVVAFLRRRALTPAREEG